MVPGASRCLAKVAHQAGGYSSFASGAVPAASQPLADDPAVRAVFRNEAVIRRAGGVECLESWLLREKAASGLIPTGTART